MNNSSTLQNEKKSVFLISLSILYCLISATGILGNALVIYVILKEKKMRITPTNIFILNMAFADLVIMLIGVEEMTHLILNRGWLLGSIACKMLRFAMTTCLYVSVLTLMAVCIERYIAIIYPIKAHIWCTKTRTNIVLILIWLVAVLCGLPIAIFSTLMWLEPKKSVSKCLRIFSLNRQFHFKIVLIVQYLEVFFYYFVPILMQIVLYTKIYLTLFKDISSNRLKSIIRPHIRKHKGDKNSLAERLNSGLNEAEMTATVMIYDDNSSNQHLSTKDRAKVNLQRSISSVNTRKQVVRMLIACVSTYFICYSPTVVRLFYSKHPLEVLIITLAYANSAANPILYSVFSQRFRTKFQKALHCF